MNRAARLGIVFGQVIHSARRGGLGWRRATGYVLRADESRTNPWHNSRVLVRVRDEGSMTGYMTGERG